MQVAWTAARTRVQPARVTASVTVNHPVEVSPVEMSRPPAAAPSQYSATDAATPNSHRARRESPENAFQTAVANVPAIVIGADTTQASDPVSGSDAPDEPSKAAATVPTASTTPPAAQATVGLPSRGVRMITIVASWVLARQRIRTSHFRRCRPRAMSAQTPSDTPTSTR